MLLLMKLWLYVSLHFLASRKRDDHPMMCLLLQAVMYFQRALKQDRRFLNAWTLMGHEYVEMKNPPAAIGKQFISLLET